MSNNPNQETQRTLLATERTFLSYVRTSFAFIIFGFAFAEFSDRSFSQGLGIVFAASGVGLLLVGLVIFLIRRSRILKR